MEDFWNLLRYSEIRTDWARTDWRRQVLLFPELHVSGCAPFRLRVGENHKKRPLVSSGCGAALPDVTVFGQPEYTRVRLDDIRAVGDED